MNFADYKTIKTTRTEYEKKGSKWLLKDKIKYLMSEKQYDNFTDKRWKSYMKSLGGYEREEKAYTKRGYRTIRNTSISPDRNKKIVVDFDFKNSDKLYDRAILNYRKSYKNKS